MNRKEFEKKFLVINWKHLRLQQIEQPDVKDAIKDFKESLARLNGLRILPNNKYYVCNQDEPYAPFVIDIILRGEELKDE